MSSFEWNTQFFVKSFRFHVTRRNFEISWFFFGNFFTFYFFFPNKTIEEQQIFDDSYSHWPGLSATVFIFSGKRAFDSLKLFKVFVLGTFLTCFRLSSSFRTEYNFWWNRTYFYRVLHDKCYRNMSGYSDFALTPPHIVLRASCTHSSFTVSRQFLNGKRSCFWRQANNYCHFVC